MKTGKSNLGYAMSLKNVNVITELIYVCTYLAFFFVLKLQVGAKSVNVMKKLKFHGYYHAQK